VGDALHQTGHWAEAEAHFHEAEELWGETYPQAPLLCGLAGFQYCDLLAAAAERAAWRQIQESELANVCCAVSERAAQTLQWAESWQQDILSASLDHLTIGRAALYVTILQGESMVPSLTQDDQQLRDAGATLNIAVTGLRRAGHQHHLPRGLLTRAWLRFLENDSEDAQADLDEAWEIAERGPMRLYMADIHLYRARLFHGVKPYPWTSPQEDLAAARKLIEQCGYWRRKEELEDAEAAAKNW
jgi:hypothetical protein